MKKRLFHSACVLLVVIQVAVGVRVYSAVAGSGEEKADAGYTSMAVFARAMQIIRQDYVDEKKADYDQLTRAAMRGMLSSLDPHSQFMEPGAFKEMQDDTHNRFGGLGLHVTIRDGALVVVSPMEASPGFRAGIQPGDQILKIEGKPTEKMEINDAIGMLRGEVGKPVNLTILRAGTREIKEYSLVRENINVASVKDAKLLDPDLAGDFKVGYLRITQFGSPTADELGARLDELEKKGMQALVLDLRHNPGGLIDSAVNVAGQFLPPKTAVVSTEGRLPSQSRVYLSQQNAKVRPKYPIAVLINWGSASGSEIVAGALKDLKRAILVGETTFGKGSVQSVIQLQDGSAMRLTTAKYYTPSKQVIHERGVTPNIHATLTAEQERLLILQRKEELASESDKKELAAFRDSQLERAVDALKGTLIFQQKNAADKKASSK